MIDEEKKTITREKHPGRVAQGHKLAALMKKRKEEILRNKEQSTEQSTVPSTVQSTEQSLQYSLQYSPENSLQYSQMEPMSMALVCFLSLRLAFVYFLRTTRRSMKNPLNQKDVICFRKNIQLMSNCDCQENIEDEATVADKADKEPITFGDGLL